MGVPAFYRWLTIRYPKVVIDALSEDDLEILADEYDKEKQGNSSGAGGGGPPGDSNEINLDLDD